MPAAGMGAIGASIGATVPRDASLDNGLEIAGNIEGYLTPRVSVRGQLGTTWWDIVGRRVTGTVRPLFVDGNIVYNWEGGAVHPYVTAGVGMYRFHLADRASEGHDTKAGLNLGGGIEYFFTRHATMTGELLYHKVNGFSVPNGAFADGSFWSFAIGGKAYLGR